MRLYPAQIAVRLICGLPIRSQHDPQDTTQRMRDGHKMLVQMTNKDFGYDLQAWHDYLKESRDGGYTYGRNIVLPKAMRAALDSKKWQEAAAQLRAERPESEPVL